MNSTLFYSSEIRLVYIGSQWHCKTCKINCIFLLIPAAERSRVRVRGRLLAGVVYLLCVLCVVRYRSLRQADPSSRGFLQTVVCS